jgi:enoyl-CoA hydratase/carnithine racemase
VIEYELSGNAARVTLNRPEKLNALDYEAWRDFREYLDRGAEEARVVVLEGEGDAFCAGDDINELADLETADDYEEHGMLASTIYRIEKTGVPVIAAVDGIAYGAGFEIVGACDLAVATPDSSFAWPEPRIGGYSPFAAERMEVLATRKRVMELSLLGEPIDAETALDWGLVNRVVDESDLEPTVEEFVRLVSLSPKRSIRTAKEYANDRIGDGREEQRMTTSLSQLYRSETSQEGLRAFLEDREPNFRSGADDRGPDD